MEFLPPDFVLSKSVSPDSVVVVESGSLALLAEPQQMTSLLLSNSALEVYSPQVFWYF